MTTTTTPAATAMTVRSTQTMTLKSHVREILNSATGTAMLATATAALI